MRATRTATATLATAIALLVLPTAAPAEYLVPPSNSAATQYTETVPTSGGGRDSEKGGKDRSPAEVLGERNAEKLHEHGEAGRKVAEVVATTAPAPAPEPQPVEAEPAPAPDRGEDDQPREEKQRQGLGEAVAVAAAGGGGPGPTAPQASGSSGIGEVLAQATGLSSAGQLGLLLPLAIALTAAWALAFLLRQRRQPTP